MPPERDPWGYAVSTFAEATEIDGTAGRYVATLDPEWTVFGRPHGGYLLAILAKAAIATSDGQHPHPVAASAMYLSPPAVGKATVEVTPLRQGRTVSQFRTTLSQDGAPRMEALLTLGVLGEEQTWTDAAPVEFTPFAECFRSPVEPFGPGGRIAMMNVVDQRIDPDSLVVTSGGVRPSSEGSGEIRTWLAFADGTPFDPVSLLYAADSSPPATLTLGSFGWVPTVELTTYIRTLPAPGPLRVRQRVRMLAGSVADQVCEIWDAKDRVVAQATQLCLVRFAGS